MASLAETNTTTLATLAARYLKVEPRDLSLIKLAGDASTRTYFRATSAGASVIVARYSEAFDERELAADRLAKSEASNPAARLTFANDPCAHIEVTKLLREGGLPVPEVVSTSGSDAVMLIEDVGDIRLQDWLSGRADDEVTQAYGRAIELIVKIQDATQPALEAGSICSKLAFDEAKLRWELGFFFANYFNRYLHLRLEPSESNAVQEDFQVLCSELSSRPRVLTHRDYHARNLMMYRGAMWIIDHQDARMGPASYDVASLLSDPYTNLQSEVVEQLIEQFIAMKAKSRLPLPETAAFRSELDLMTVQRMLKAVGTYASQAAAGNLVYVNYINPAIERAQRAMESLGRFRATLELLTRSMSVRQVS